MDNQRTILCGELAAKFLTADGGGSGRETAMEVLPFRLSGPGANVTLRVDHISERVGHHLSARFLDLIEIATYVYCADQAVARGGAGVEDMGDRWRRLLAFHIPVREPDFWNSNPVLAALTGTLGFLSEDQYQFEFVPDPAPPRGQQYFLFEDAARDREPEEVVLFSGGLDSLAGAVRESVVERRRVALVTHRPTGKFKSRHDQLCRLLDGHTGPAFEPWHVPVTINKDKGLSREYTQRSRSFLYAALAATVACLYQLPRIRFYENGIVSLNLPLSPQVVGAKATRTTHPRVLAGFRELLSLVADRPFDVQNPFAWQSKADVVRSIAAAGCSDTIGLSTSCTHTWEKSHEYPHCGGCSQCIDRRFAVLAAGQEAHDPASGYRIDLETGTRDPGEHRTMLAAYVETSRNVARMDELSFFARYGEVSRVLKYMDGTADAVASRVFALYQRHARDVCRVVTEAVARHSAQIFERSLPDSCMVRLVSDSSGSESGAIHSDVPPGNGARNLAVAGNVFTRKGMYWVVRFHGGEENIYPPSRGMEYLYRLISSPKRPLRALNLVLEVSKAPERLQLGDGGERLDADAIRAYRMRHEELQDELVDARAAGDANGEAQALREMGFLVKELANAGWNGRLKKEKHDRRRLQASFAMAVSRALSAIERFDKALADHFRSPTLRRGAQPVYDPPQPIDWDL